MRKKLKQTEEEVVSFGAFYGRYSAATQNDASIEQQLELVEDYAAQHNIRIVAKYADRAISGRTDSRPQFQRMIRDAEHANWDYVLVWKLDRFGRNRRDAVVYKYKLSKLGVRVLSATEAIPDGAEGMFLEGMLEVQAEYFSINSAENVSRGLYYNADRAVLNSKAPYGYIRGKDGKAEINPETAPIVREIFEKVAAGQSFVDISANLNSRGITTGYGRPWGKSSYNTLIHNERYTGIYIYGDVRIEGGMPQIVPPDLFARVQLRLGDKDNPRKGGRRHVNNDFILTGKLYCGHCKSPMVGISGHSRSGNPHYYYSCKQHRAHMCAKKNVRKEWIEQLVAQATAEILLTDSAIELLADEFMRYQLRTRDTSEEDRLKARLSETKSALANIMKAIEMGILTETTKARLLELEESKRQIERDIQTRKIKYMPISRDQTVYFLRMFQGGNPADKDFQKKLFETFVNKIYLYDDKIRVYYNYSGQNNFSDVVLRDESTEGSVVFDQSASWCTNSELVEQLVVMCLPACILLQARLIL